MVLKLLLCTRYVRNQCPIVFLYKEGKTPVKFLEEFSLFFSNYYHYYFGISISGICDMIKENESDVGNFEFELQA